MSLNKGNKINKYIQLTRVAIERKREIEKKCVCVCMCVLFFDIL